MRAVGRSALAHPACVPIHIYFLEEPALEPGNGMALDGIHAEALRCSAYSSAVIDNLHVLVLQAIWFSIQLCQRMPAWTIQSGCIQLAILCRHLAEVRKRGGWAGCASPG